MIAICDYRPGSSNSFRDCPTFVVNDRKAFRTNASSEILLLFKFILLQIEWLKILTESCKAKSDRASRHALKRYGELAVRLDLAPLAKNEIRKLLTFLFN